MKTVLRWVIASLPLMLIACGRGLDEAALPDKETIPVTVLPLKQQKVSPSVSTSGQFSSDDETYLSFKMGGVIAGIYVREGDAVRKGQLLASLQAGEIDAMVQQAKAAEEKARRDYVRVQNLFADSVASLEQLQNVKTGLDVAVKQLAIAEFNRRYSDIRALADGFVLKKLAAEGQVVAPGTPVVETNGARRGIWLLTASLSDREWIRVQKNDNALVSLDVRSQEKLPAVVWRKSEGVDPRTGTFSVDLKLTGPPPFPLASGLFGRALIRPGQTMTAWIVPYGALVDADGDSGYLFVTDDNATARKVRVSLGEMLSDSVLVLGGLETAKSLIVSGSAYLADNATIRIAQ